MSIVATAGRSLPTLNKLSSGTPCPNEHACICRISDWCRQNKQRFVHGGPELPMSHLTGCSFRNPACCCQMLDEIEHLAKRYLMQADLKGPPIPLDLIDLFDANRPIEFRSLPLKQCFGAAWLLGEEWVIHLNANVSPAERRFTAFHEGFHIICRNSGMRIGHTEGSVRPLVERLADYFASSILLPWDFICDLPPEALSPEWIARTFDVPKRIARVRLMRIEDRVMFGDTQMFR